MLCPFIFTVLLLLLVQWVYPRQHVRRERAQAGTEGVVPVVRRAREPRPPGFGVRVRVNEKQNERVSVRTNEQGGWKRTNEQTNK